MPDDLLSLHDILAAWRDGGITTAEAQRLARIDTEDALREAAMLSGVLPDRLATADDLTHQAKVESLVASDDCTPLRISAPPIHENDGNAGICRPDGPAPPDS